MLKTGIFNPQFARVRRTNTLVIAHRHDLLENYRQSRPILFGSIKCLS